MLFLNNNISTLSNIILLDGNVFKHRQFGLNYVSLTQMHVLFKL